ncbi:MAG: FKBP-type peptidyl-prolyl cis-trans isomerase [Bacteroidales bacterium]|nr:FKBP-type peptidyl-prolyl cis-trans isomerase [Bacteroidales bacterium]
MHRIAFLLLALLTACHPTHTEPPKPATKADGEYLIGIHKDIVRNEATDIRLFIQRYGWNMQGDPSGYFYEILDEGHGELLKNGDKAMLRCRISLLDGTIVYDSGRDGLKSVVIEHSDEPVGLQEALRRMRHGTRARLVLPSHLAYGSLGDGGGIPGFAPIVYTLEVLD